MDCRRFDQWVGKLAALGAPDRLDGAADLPSNGF